MDYGQVLSRAWKIAWRWKILWILGFLAGTPGWSSLLSNGNGAQYRYDGRYNAPLPDWAVGLIVAAACIGLLLFLALAVISIIARGGLIAGVQQVEEEGRTTFGNAWRAGARRFWTLLGITVATWLPIVILIAAIVVLTILSVAGAVLGNEQSEPAAALGALAPWAVCGIPLCLIMIVVFLAVGLIQTYADRAAMIEGLAWIDAIKRGWDMLRHNLGTTLIFWLIFVVIGSVVAAVFAGLFFAFFLPAAGLASSRTPGWIVFPICGGLIALVAIAVASAIVGTFTSATWTLVYRELLGLTRTQPATPAAPIAPPAPPAPPDLAEL